VYVKKLSTKKLFIKSEYFEVFTSERYGPNVLLSPGRCLCWWIISLRSIICL